MLTFEEKMLEVLESSKNTPPESHNSIPFLHINNNIDWGIFFIIIIKKLEQCNHILNHNIFEFNA